ncbi:MAG: peptide chain release factor N(5)-glutamine methyltransferase [Anaerolineales bacterium]|nr:peptide chain release factor N(5)-glutamine methyltransferase [Anaerolineales bacterium]MCB8939313.1 peptide chain release factor N(5)-glutamine methyltransferase [Ardenticatenaceae bacterium]
MNIQEALVYGRSQLTPTSPTPQLDARLLLEHLLEVPHSYLIVHHNQPLTAEQTAAYHQLIARATQTEPIPYIIGHAPFFDFDIHVAPGVLIPRPETEQLVELAVAWARKHDAQTAVDVGTGSGCIAITLAHFLPSLQVTAVDISPQALAIAQQNGARLAPGRVHFQQSNLLSALETPVDLIVANLPYVTSGEWQGLADGVKLHEPALALDGGADGLDLIRQLLQQATTRLRPGGAIFLEIGWQQGTIAQQAAQHCFPEAQITVLPDFAGHDRIVKIVST